MYQVIARKYRPQSFADVVNQEHVKTTLDNALRLNRIAHGYIFSGQRGTGKTTVARILARCLNCRDAVTSSPCGVCASCTEIAAGGSVDVIEIDAASNRGINEMRELRENVRYRPARDRYKIFIVDEAHQITNEAFNALLKTIEEPPEWVVFVLCTTEAHKIPATIASRCQHFSFRSVDFDDLVARMAWICEQEGITADHDALAVIAQAGEGSVRDSLSALDQAIACCGNTLSAAEVRSLLGGFSLESLHEVTQSLESADSSRMLAIVDELERNGRNLQHFSRELSRYFRNLLVAKVAGAETRLIAASNAERTRLASIAAAFSEEDLTRYLQLSLDLFRDLQFSLQPRFHLELGLVRMVHAGRLVGIEEALSALRAGAPPPAVAAPARTERPPAAYAPPPPPAPRPAAPVRSGPSPFEADRLKKATKPEPLMSAGANALSLAPGAAPGPVLATQQTAPPQQLPQSRDEWRERLVGALTELGLQFTADAVEHSDVEAAAGELRFTTPKDLVFAMGKQDINRAAERVAGKQFKITVTAGAAGGGSVRVAAPPSAEDSDELSRRVLDNPEVQRFRELFPGEVRNIRDLKE